MTDVSVAHVKHFDAAIRAKAQQTNTRMAMTALDRGNVTGESFTISSLEAATGRMTEVTTRFGDTVFRAADHEVRNIPMRDFFEALPVDRTDLPKLLVDPASGSYQKNLLSLWAREQDALFYDAARGNTSLKDGSTVALPASQKIAAGGTGLTKAKIVQTRKLFRSNEQDQHNGKQLYMAYTADMLEDILANDTELIDQDIIKLQLLQAGDLKGEWAGFIWTPYESVDVVGSEAFTIAWCDDAIHKGTGYMEGNIDNRPDKRRLKQVSLEGSIAFGRAEETGVVEIAYAV